MSGKMVSKSEVTLRGSIQRRYPDLNDNSLCGGLKLG